MQQNELNKIIDQLNDVFGSKGELLTTLYGNVHKYLGMTIHWTIVGKVVFTMYNYLEDILVEAPLNFDVEDVTPAVSELFSVNETHQKVDATTAYLFHRIVTRFLYVAKRARPDLQVAIETLELSF